MFYIRIAVCFINIWIFSPLPAVVLSENGGKISISDRFLLKLGYSYLNAFALSTEDGHIIFLSKIPAFA